MKTSDSIEGQEERKAARDNRVSGDSQGDSSRVSKPPVRQKLKKLDASRIAAWRWQPGQSGNPNGRHKGDLASEIARAAFERNADALYKAFSKALLKGNAYAFKELSDRAYGRLKERIEVEAGPLRNMSDDDLKVRIAELEKQLGLVPALPPASEDSKPN